MARTRLTALPMTVLPVVVAALLAAPAAAAPRCTDTAPNVRTCVTPGHTAIVSTPTPGVVSPLQGWGQGWGVPIFGLGGGGVWIGF